MSNRTSVIAALAAGLLVACSGPDSGAVDSGSVVEADYRGAYSYMADAALFTECATGITYPVAPEGDAATLERAYLQLQTGPGEPLLVSLRGHVAPRPRPDGGTEDALVVTTFQTVFIGEACSATAGDQPLEGPQWTALDVMGLRPPEEDPPTLMVEARTGLIGWSGCGGFTGTYTVQGTQLSFSSIVRPDEPCTGSLNRLEQSFLQVIQATTSYEILGDTLRLSGRSGTLALFVAQ